MLSMCGLHFGRRVTNNITICMTLKKRKKVYGKFNIEFVVEALKLF